MAISTKFVSKMADLTARPENLPSIRLLFGGRGVLSRWDVSMRRIGLWHLYRNLTPGGRLILPDRTVDMSPEKIYFIPGYTPIAVTMTTKTMEHCYVDFEIIGQDFENIEKHLFEFDAADYRQQLADCFGGGFSSLACCSLIFSLLHKIVPHSFRTAFETVSDPRIKTVLEMIERAFAARQYQHLTNRALSRQTCVSVDSFRHLFLKEMKVSPQRYILQKKLALAKKLLLSGNVSIDEIAVVSGFGDRYQMTKHFTAEFGQPPARLRRSFQKHKLSTME